MYRSTLLLAAASLATSAVIQQPITEQGSDSLPLVDSSCLQGDISTPNLLKRARHLYEIAEESVHEYNHPTRVIGSQGMLQLFLLSGSLH